MKKTIRKTSGSGVSFVHQEIKSVISLHKLHNPDILKEYQIKAILMELQDKKII